MGQVQSFDDSFARFLNLGVAEVPQREMMIAWALGCDRFGMVRVMPVTLAATR